MCTIALLGLLVLTKLTLPWKLSKKKYYRDNLLISSLAHPEEFLVKDHREKNWSA